MPKKEKPAKLAVGKKAIPDPQPAKVVKARLPKKTRQQRGVIDLGYTWNGNGYDIR